MKNNFGIDMQQVVSSNVESVGYDYDNQVLYVRFLNGAMYTYKGVSYAEYQGLINSSSVGGYLNQFIKGAYLYERVE